MQKKVLPIILLSSLTVVSACTTPSKTSETITPAVNTVNPTSNVSGSVITTQTTAASGNATTPTSVASPTTKTVSYTTPGGEVGVTFTVAISDGVISSASSTVDAQDRESREWQGKFSRNVSKVVGKKTSEIASLDAVGGASLTTEAFKKFVESL